VSPTDPAAPLRRRALVVGFWFVAASLLLSALFGDMGIVQAHRQRRAAAGLRDEIRSLRADNDALAAEIQELKHDPYRIETIAREDLGLSRPGEIIFLFPAPAAPPGVLGPSPPAAAPPGPAPPATTDSADSSGGPDRLP
jgi:cell division protein FtsB